MRSTVVVSVSKICVFLGAATLMAVPGLLSGGASGSAWAQSAAPPKQATPAQSTPSRPKVRSGARPNWRRRRHHAPGAASVKAPVYPPSADGETPPVSTTPTPTATPKKPAFRGLVRPSTGPRKAVKPPADAPPKRSIEVGAKGIER